LSEETVRVGLGELLDGESSPGARAF
jgi:hypothetical protein